MISHSQLIDDGASIAELAQKLRQKSVIAFDTEFIRETTFFPIVEIIQIATDEESWLVDAKKLSGGKHAERGVKPEALKPLLEVLEDEHILKIGHAVQGDQECLFTAFGTMASPCVDTAIAASLCGYGESIGLGNLLKAVLKVKLKKGHARTNWSVRPLPEQLAEYAHLDVIHLVELWKSLEAKLEAKGRREWALRASARLSDRKLYEPDPDAIALKLASGGRLDASAYAVLIELVRWRELRVRELDLPRRWLADDNVLMDLARVRPKDAAHLGTFRGINKGELKHSAVSILEAIRRGVENKGILLPGCSEHEPPSVAESQAIDLLRCYINILSDSHRISSRFLMTSVNMLELIRLGGATIEELVDKKILGVEAAALIGKDVIDFVRGRRALYVSDGKVFFEERD